MRPLRVAELCAGFGGLGRGLTLAGIDHTVEWFSEIDKHAAAVFQAHHPDAPNLGDLTKITDPPEVDIIAAGWPCQPVSMAGARKGTEDDRWIIEDVCRVASESGAMWLLLENVRGLLTANDGNALGAVCAALARYGFDAEWTTVRASDAGAPHRRERWFCLATNSARIDERRVSARDRGGESLCPIRDGCSHIATADSADEEQRQSTVGGVRPESWGSVEVFREFTPAVRRWEAILGRAAPTPGLDGRVNPAFIEWMIGLPDGYVSETLPRNGLTANQHRDAITKCLGNGVVPLQAALAVRLLADRLNQ